MVLLNHVAIGIGIVFVKNQSKITLKNYIL